MSVSMSGLPASPALLYGGWWWQDERFACSLRALGRDRREGGGQPCPLRLVALRVDDAAGFRPAYGRTAAASPSSMRELSVSLGRKKEKPRVRSATQTRHGVAA